MPLVNMVARDSFEAPGSALHPAAMPSLMNGTGTGPPPHSGVPVQWEEERVPAALIYRAALAQLLQMFVTFTIPVS